MASSQFPVAIIGMATKLPAAETCNEFWDLLQNGGDTVAKFPRGRIADIEHVISTFRGQLVNEDDPFFTGSFFESVDTFDAELFEIEPEEAVFLEPEQRFFLETTWEAIEDAGYASTIRGSNTGVYVGNAVSKYKYILTENHPSILHTNYSPFISSRASYTYNLQGPAMMIASGCSSSLLAVHVACQGLLSGDCDMAIAGGIALDLLPINAKRNIQISQIGITDSGVKSHEFDASTKGIAMGEGCGIVVLKSLEKAVMDNDYIYGVLEATASNQDGHSNGTTAPHSGAQVNVLGRAWKLADISPDKLGYFETHGIGSKLGDFKIFGFSCDQNDAASKIPMGSVNTNIGHLADGADGVVSLIKVLMCLQKGKIPPTINFTKPNPHVNSDSTPVYVNTTLKEWPLLKGTPTRYASVSAFCPQGTNVHAVVREYSRFPRVIHALDEHCQESQLLTLAANTQQSLVTFVGRIANFFHQSETKSHIMLRNVCFTLNTGREQKRFTFRAVAFATTWKDMSQALEELHQNLYSTTSARASSDPEHSGYFVNLGNTTLANVKLPIHLNSVAKLFLDGQEICWKTFYTEKNELSKVSLLPNYAFDRERFWPTFSKAIKSQKVCKLVTENLDTNKPTNEIQNHACKAKEPHFEERVHAVFPLSFSQKRLWVMGEMAVTSCAYNATNCLRITGNFHPEAFVSAANNVLSRHDAFFTIIRETNEGPVQAHNWKADVTVKEEDMRQFGAQAEEMTTALYRDNYKTRFDLRAGPPVRCKLYRLPDDVFYFTMVIHHILFDEWSHFVFYNELWDYYHKLCEDKRVIEDLHRPLYTEFAEEEQNGPLTSPMDSHVKYWKDKLAPPLPVTTFPGDKQRPPIFTCKGGRITRFLDNQVLQAFNEFCSERYTVFVKLLSVVFILLHKYTGERDLIIGTPVPGRSDMRYRHVIGCFINCLALRLQIPDRCDFKDILDEVSAIFVEAFDHQTAPFDLLVSQLNLTRDTSITPVFSVSVCCHNTEIKAEHTSPPSEISVESKLLHNETTKWDMQFDFLQEAEGIRFTLEYYSDVFSDQYAESIVDNVIWLIKSCCGNENILLTQLVLGAMGETKKKPPVNEVSILCGALRQNETSLAVLLKESLQAQAKNTAVVEADKLKVTYEELLHRAIERSWFLREVCKLPKQSRIGLLLENCADTIEYILASVFSGLVYVPLDACSPKSRTEHMCNEAEIKAIVFRKSCIEIANYLHWACPPVQSIICADSQDFFAIQDAIENSPLMDVELWNCVAKNAKDDIESGGWKSSYTGEHMTVEDMEEYTENVLTKVKEYLNPTTRVLEIGCASGMTMEKICPLVAQYIATDLSEIMTTRLIAELETKDVTNVEVLCVPAHQVERVLQGKKFDLIVMNSVVHCFPGYNYLRAVFKDCEKLLAKDGVIFLGDIMDLDLKHKLIMSVKSFKKAHPECRVKIDWRNELFLSRAFMQHLCDTSRTLKLVNVSRKHFTIANELTDFRFDAIFTNSEECHPLTRQAVNKQVFALQDITHAVMTQDTNSLHKVVFDWSHEVRLEDEAYVLYTSGTTGTPKGVIIGHEALVNYVTWATKAYQFDSTTVTPFFAPLTFDFTVTSIFPPLLGGSVIRVYKAFGDSYQSLASSSEITTAKYAPLQLDTILSTCTQPLSASIFILGGQELTGTLLEKLKMNKRDERFVVWNEYGPTEATVGCVVRRFESTELPMRRYEHVPIGKPIDNVTVAVVKNQQDLVPLGTRGHLAIGGTCLCLDFAGSSASRDQKRSKSYRPSCWGRPGQQMLLTEDIVELVPSTGELIYFGRDSSSEAVKVNGIKVDLLEVQHMVEADPAVVSAWVCPFVHEGYTFLGAAIILESGSQELKYGDRAWKQELVSSLTQILPVRSIPKVFVELSTAPIKRNGKKDMNYLQKLFVIEMMAEKNSFCNFTNSTNTSRNLGQIAKLQRIWQSILPIDHLPKPEDDFFFDLSGDSLQAIHLLRKMRDEGFQVFVNDIFQNPSIQKLAPILEKRSKSEK